MNYIKSLDWKKLFALGKLPFLLLAVTFALLPIFFAPSSFVSFEFSKAVFLAVGITLSFTFFLIYVLKSGTLALPRAPIFLALLAIAIIYLVSAFFSSAPIASLFGYGFEVSTFSAIIFFAALMFLVSIFFRSSERFFAIYTIFFALGILLALFHISRLFFGANFLSFGFFPYIISNTIGKWNEVAVFFGANTVLSLLALDMLRLQTKIRYSIFASLILSVAVLIFVNMALVWYVVGAFSLVLFVYLLSFDSVQSSTMNVVSSGAEQGTKMKTKGRTISFRSLAVVVIAFIFAFTPVGASLGEKIATKFKIDNIDVRPSWSATYQISKKVLKENPVLGAGPNRFSALWQKDRPDVNQTNFWNINFSHGVGFIPTSIIETGFLGAAAWLVFFALFLRLGFRALFRSSGGRFSRYFFASSFLAALYFWVMNIIYMPSAVILALTFFFTGLSVAARYLEGATTGASDTGTLSLSFGKYKRSSFAITLVIIFVLIAGLGFGYLVAEKTLASYYFSRGSSLTANGGNFDTAMGYILRAENLAPNDFFYRSIAELNILRLKKIMSDTAAEQNVSEAVQKEFQATFERAIAASEAALTWDNENYENWVSVARVYETIVPVGVPEAFERSQEAYGEALKRSPRNPRIYLALAELDAFKRNFPKMRENIAKALELKSNYLDAIFLLSQVDIAEGKIKDAISSTEKIISASPDDPVIYFRLGLLKYELKDYKGAAAAFEKAISFVPVYANARYFLGLSYEKLNRPGDAIIQFGEIQKTNPDNKEVTLILDNLKAGRPAFATAPQPLEKPEKRKKLPVEEKAN